MKRFYCQYLINVQSFLNLFKITFNLTDARVDEAMPYFTFVGNDYLARVLEK
jgi:hypothetical protein